MAVVKNLLNFIADLLGRSRATRRLLSYLQYRANGLLYGSISLDDEAALAASFLKRVESKTVFFDGGANRGLFAVAVMEQSQNPNLVGVLVEPNPQFSSLLEETCRTHDGKLLLSSVALSDKPGEADLFFENDMSTLSSLTKRDLRHVGLEMSNSVRVEVETIVNVLDRHNIESCDFLKLDLEGSEYAALLGASPLLATGKISALSFEFGGCNIDSRTFIKDFWRLLVVQYGYKLYRVLPGRRVMAIEYYDESLEQFQWQTLLACRKDVHPAWPVHPH